MKEQSIQAILAVISSWKSKKQYLYEDKQVHVIKSPIVKGEILLYASNQVPGILKNGQSLNTYQRTETLQTNTLSQDPISGNSNSDAYSLKQLLERFDSSYYPFIESLRDEADDVEGEPFFF